jgi:hypothetical protein
MTEFDGREEEAGRPRTAGASMHGIARQTDTASAMKLAAAISWTTRQPHPCLAVDHDSIPLTSKTNSRKMPEEPEYEDLSGK